MRKVSLLNRLGICIAVVGLLAACGRSSEAPQQTGSATKAPPSSPSATNAAAGQDSEAEYDKGAALAAAGKLEEARAVFLAAARLDPGDGALASGAAMFRDLAETRVSGDAVQRMFRAMQHGDAGQWAEAHADADEALNLAPQYPRAHATKAALLIFQGEYPSAIQALDKAIKLDPGFAEAFYNRGAVRAELKQFDAAIGDYNRAIELNPSFWDAYRNRGSAHTHKNNPRAAIADFTKAHELRPRAVDPCFFGASFMKPSGGGMRQWPILRRSSSSTQAMPRHTTIAD